MCQEFIESLHDLHEEWLLGPQSASLSAPVVVSIIVYYFWHVKYSHYYIEDIALHETDKW